MVNAVKEYKHCLQSFQNLIAALPIDAEPNKLNHLVKYVDHFVYELLADCADYNSTLEVLKNLYIKPRNKILARYLITLTAFCCGPHVWINIIRNNIKNE